MSDDPYDMFFAAARERQHIYLRRAAGAPWPWTEDPIFRQYRFCNVFREQDATTRWLRENVRSRMPIGLQLLAAVVFRWFNRIATGQAIFSQMTLGEETGDPATAFCAFARTGRTEPLREAIRAFCGRGPYVTGAYMIRSPAGTDKLSGVLDLIGRFYHARLPLCLGGRLLCHASWRDVTLICADLPGKITLRDVWEWVGRHHYLGGFLAYEVVTDLRHTRLLRDAPDVDTWACAEGPGARRGAARLLGDVRIHPRWGSLVKASVRDTESVMARVLDMSRSSHYWPQTATSLCSAEEAARWPRWEMRDAEHWLCEWDKYERARLGQGRLKRRYVP